MRLRNLLATGSVAAWLLCGMASAHAITGDYLEVRSCDVFTGPCFANAEMGLTGKEGILVWHIREGQWNGVSLNGLSVIAVVRTEETMGDTSFRPRKGRSVVIVDSKATAAQRDALVGFAAAKAGDLVSQVVAVHTSTIEATMGVCAKSGCSTIKAEGMVEVSTRCMGAHDHICGNEELFYPPLTKVSDPIPAYTEVAAYQGRDLDVTWSLTSQRGAYLASFEY